MKRLKGGIVNLLFIFGGLFLGLVIIELLIPYYWEGQTSELYRLGEALEHEPTLGWVNKPGYSRKIKPPDTFFGRMEYFHNSRGLRDEEYTYEKPDDVYRILMLGDSFTFGWGVRQSETCADRLETALKEQGPFEVINTGVVAYNTTQEVLYYKVEGYKYQPDLVILMFCQNDIVDHVEPGSRPSPAFNLVGGKLVLRHVPYPPPPSLEDASSRRRKTILRIEKRLRQHLQFRWIRYLIEGVLARINPQRSEPFIPPNYWESGWEIIEVILKQMKEDVEKQGGKLVVVSIPSIYRDLTYSSSPESEMMNSICTREGIAHIDLQPGFSQSAFYPYFRFNDHWNAGGHRLAAEIIYDELLEANFEPQPAFKAVGVVFEDQLTLSGCAYGGNTSNFVEHKVLSGEKAWVALRWQGRDLQEDYRISIRLVDERGHVVGQVDKLLIDDQDRPTSTWAEGVMVTDYCLLPVWPATPPGEYSLRLVVYSSATLEPLTVREGGNGLGVELGALQVERAMRNPALETLEIESLLGADMKEVRLLGYTLSVSGPPQPGEKMALHLYWQAKRDVKRDYGLLLHLRDEAGGFVPGGVRRLTGDAYPTTKWRKGEILHGWYDFALPADIPPGAYRLVAEMMDMVTGQSLKEIDLGDLRVEDRPRRFEVPFIQHPLEANLGDKVEFLGYDLGPAPLTAGETLFLTLYWQAQDGIETSYKVFTHLLGEDDHIWGQKDDVPGQGDLPTTGWVKGEVIVDEYEIMIHQGAPDGKYRLKIGMYDPLTGERLPVIGEKGKIEGDGVVLDKVQIGP